MSLAQLPSYHVLVSAGVDRDAYVWNPFVSTLVTKLVGTLAVDLSPIFLSFLFTCFLFLLSLSRFPRCAKLTLVAFAV